MISTTGRACDDSGDADGRSVLQVPRRELRRSLRVGQILRTGLAFGRNPPEDVTTCAASVDLSVGAIESAGAVSDYNRPGPRVCAGAVRGESAGAITRYNCSGNKQCAKEKMHMVLCHAASSAVLLFSSGKASVVKVRDAYAWRAGEQARYQSDTFNRYKEGIDSHKHGQRDYDVALACEMRICVFGKRPERQAISIYGH